MPLWSLRCVFEAPSGSVFVGEEGGFNLDNWCRVNLNPGLSKGKAGWLPELTPLDRQIGEANLLDQCHVHAGFQNAYMAARSPLQGGAGMYFGTVKATIGVRVERVSPLNTAAFGSRTPSRSPAARKSSSLSTA